jgi:uncharacterized membrane protein YdjX (TVP38/TMEM64 family)
MESAEPIQANAFWRRARRQRVAACLIGVGAVAAGVVVLGDELGRHLDVVESWIAGLGPWAPVGFTFLYAVLSSIFVPDILLGIVAGSSFGFTRGLGVVAAGTIGGAALQYALSRRLLKPVIDRFLASRPHLAAIQRAVRQQELRLQLLIRLTPLNRALTSYMLGASGVGFTRFAAACLALLPSLSLEVYLGYAGKHLARSTGQRHSVALHELALIIGLVMAVAAMVIVSRTARRALDAAAASLPGRPVSTREAGEKLDRL